MNLVERVREWWYGVKWMGVKRMIHATIADNGFAYAYLRNDGQNELICIYHANSYRNHRGWNIDEDDFNYHYVDKAVYGTFVLTRIDLEDIVLHDRWELERTRQGRFQTSGDRAREAVHKALWIIENANTEDDPWIPVLTDPNGIVWGLNRRSNIRRSSDEITFVVDMVDPLLREYPNRRLAPACFRLERLHTYPGQWMENPGALIYPDEKPAEELKIRVDLVRITGNEKHDLEVLSDIEGSHLMDAHRYRVTIWVNQKLPRDKRISPYYVNKKIMEFLREDIPSKVLVTDTYTYRDTYTIDTKLEGGEYATEKCGTVQ